MPYRTRTAVPDRKRRVLRNQIAGWRGFSTLDAHLHTQAWSEFAPRLVEARLAVLHKTLELYAPAFDQAVEVKARSLIIFMALFFALVPMLVFLRRRRPLIAHAVFSLHFYSFLLLLLCVAAVVQAMIGRAGGFGFTSDGVDHFLSVSLLMASAVYLYFSIAPVYGTRGVARVAASLVFTTCVCVIALGYRFALLLITLYSTS